MNSPAAFRERERERESTQERVDFYVFLKDEITSSFYTVIRSLTRRLT
jgi:hypothetical protein